MKWIIIFLIFGIAAISLANIQMIPTPILWVNKGASHPQPVNAILTEYDGGILTENGTNIICESPLQHP